MFKIVRDRSAAVAITVTTMLLSVVSIAPAQALGTGLSATNMSTAETYNERTLAIDLANITITSDRPYVRAVLTLSNPSLGTLTTPDGGGIVNGLLNGVQSNYNSQTGVWDAVGEIANVNALLAAVHFVPATNALQSFAIATTLTDEQNEPVIGLKQVTAIDRRNLYYIDGADTAEHFLANEPSAVTRMFVNVPSGTSAIVKLKLGTNSTANLQAPSGSGYASLSVISGKYWQVAGNLAEINATLDALTYVPAIGFVGTDSIQVEVSTVPSSTLSQTTIKPIVVVTLRQCGPGYYSETGDNSIADCLPSPLGFYVPDSSATHPTPCPAGTFMGSTGQTSCTAASIGYFAPVASGREYACPPGMTTRSQFSTNSNACVRAITPAALISGLAPNRSYVGEVTFGVTLPTDWYLGSVKILVISSDGQIVRTISPRTDSWRVGTSTNFSFDPLASANDLAANPKVFDVSTTDAHTPPLSSSERMPNGIYSVSVSYQDSFADPMTTTSVTDLYFGTRCAPGEFGARNSSTGAVTCRQASRGYYVPNSGDGSTEERCTAGTYTDAVAQITCTDASPGSYVPQSGSSIQLLCPLGTYADTSANRTCAVIDPGTYTPAEGTVTPSICERGTYQPETGYTGTTCLAAGPGHFVPEPQSRTQLDCEAGSYQQAFRQSTCVLADIGFYVDTTAASAQTPCPAHTMNTEMGSHRASDCKPLGCIIAKGKSATAVCLLAPLGYTVAKTSKVTYKVTAAGTAKCALKKGSVVPKQAGQCSVKVTIKPKTGAAIVKNATIFAS